MLARGAHLDEVMGSALSHQTIDPEQDGDGLVTSALETVCGGAIVLDEALRVVSATHTAERLLGVPVHRGDHAVKLFCGESIERPLAEALAAGQPVVATVPRLRSETCPSEKLLRVRATPLRRQGRVAGWILLIAEELAAPSDGPEELHGMWTRDALMKRLFRLAEKVAHTDVNVLVEGEMGTGKASLAAAIHGISVRRGAPFRSVNCVSATPELIGRHLADGGTLFFDDIAELSPDAQGELLRVLEGIALPLDGGKTPPLDVRIIAATRTAPAQAVEHGRLRADLMYRLRIVSLHLPPLRARRGDVALLAEKFIAELNARGGRRIERVAPATLERLIAHTWPGNVRELRVAIESAFATGEGPVLVVADLPTEIAEPFAPHEPVTVSAPPPPPSDVDEATRIRRALERAGGDRMRAATMLGMSRTTLWRRMRALGLLLAMMLLGCGGTSRFALRSPVLRDSDDRLLSQAPAKDEESDSANTVDVTVLGPLSRGFAFRSSGEAHNVNALDEVPDSTWFTNRTVRPDQLARGPCPDANAAAPPFTIGSSKIGGTTPGFVVKDARKQPYVMKVDSVNPWEAETATSADAIVSRLYWAIGFNAPCNDVVYVAPSDLGIDARSYEALPTGDRVPLTTARLDEVFADATLGPTGAIRFNASRLIEGEPLGTWRTEGTRKDDPNDVIPHEDRRELRGEYFLAAWVAHWDSRGPNSFDAFVRPPGARGGYVRHYFLDFSESLGGMSARTQYPELRQGFASVSNIPVVIQDLFTFGFPRRPWDEVRIDPRFPNLGYFDVAHFNALDFSPQTPLVRWIRAEPADRAWMARKIARLDLEHIRVAVHAGRLSNPAEEARLVEILAGRREKILRASFNESSPLADVAIEGDRLCATDLGITTKLTRPESVSYIPPAERNGDRICVRLAHTGDYGTVEVARVEVGRKTVLRAHVYDLGRGRGFFLAGLERF